MNDVDIELNIKKLNELSNLLKDYNRVFPSSIEIGCLENCTNKEIKQLLNDLYGESLKNISTLSKAEVRTIWSEFNKSVQYYHRLPINNIYKCAAWAILINNLQKRYFSLDNIVNPSNKPRLFDIYPELSELIDDDGLMNLSSNLYYYENNDHYAYKEHILFYHRFLEVDYAKEMTQKFNKLYQKEDSKNKFRIAFDFNRVCKVKDFRRIYLFDTWYGREFDVNKIDDPNFIGLTVKSSDKKSSGLMKNLDRTEFYWKYDKKQNLKTFEIEEIVDLNYLRGGYNVNRYIHSERDIKKKKFIHLDGAIKIYGTSNYQERFDSKMPKEYKADKYIKLFRIDGDISYRDWSELISFYYKYNRMIIEYFDFEEYKKLFP